MKNKFRKVVCEGCGSSFVYTRLDGTIVCRRCGHITKQKKEVFGE